MIFFSHKNILCMQTFSLLCSLIYSVLQVFLHSSGEKANEHSRLKRVVRRLHLFLTCCNNTNTPFTLQNGLYLGNCVSSNFLANNEQVPPGLLALSCAHFFGVNYLFY